jgi:hypothetical protein
MRVILIILTLTMLSTSAFAECYQNSYGRTECNNGEQAGAITLILAPPGSQKKTKMESLRRRPAGAAEPRPKTERAYIRAQAARIVTRQRIATAVIKVRFVRTMRCGCDRPESCHRSSVRFAGLWSAASASKPSPCMGSRATVNVGVHNPARRKP